MFNIPFRCLILGPSNSGKTNIVMEFIHRSPDTWNKIIVCCKSKSEPLYEYLEEKIGSLIEFYEGIENIPELDTINPEASKEQTLVIFDDLVNEKKQQIIEDYFIRGRKKKCSMFYLAHDYAKCPKLIRMQCNYVVIRQLPSKRNRAYVLSEYGLDISPERLAELYKKACMNEELGFLTIDVDKMEFRKNFNQVI
jgi:hypothetical protein